MIKRFTTSVQNLPKTWVAAFAAVLVLVIALLTSRPEILAASHTNRAGQILTDAKAASGLRFSCERLPIPLNGEKVDLAISELEQALHKRPTYGHALLLLGQAHCLLGQPEEAIAPLRAFTELRPDNPVGRLELALAYDQLMHNSLPDNLSFLGSDLTLRPVFNSDDSLSLLGCAPSANPGVDCREAGWGVNRIGDPALVLVQPINRPLEFAIEVPNQATALITAAWYEGQQDLARETPPIYRIRTWHNGEEPRESIWNISPSDEAPAWKPLAHDLTFHGGQTVNVSLSILQEGTDSQMDKVWGWFAPIIVPLEIRTAQENYMKAGAAAAAEWRAAGFGGGALLLRAREAARNGDWAAAFEWFQRSDAFLFDPDTAANFPNNRRQFSQPDNPSLTQAGSVARDNPLGILPAGWSIFTHRGLATEDWVDFSIEQLASVDAEGYFQIVPLQQGLDMVIASKPLLLQGRGGFLAVSVDAYRSTSDLQVRLEIQYRNIHGEPLNVVGSLPLQSTGEWGRLGLTDFAPQEASWALIRLRIPEVSAGGEAVRFRNVIFEYISPSQVLGL